MVAELDSPEANNPDAETNEISVFTPEFARHPQPVYQRALARCPITRMAFTGSAVVSRYDDVMEILRNPELYSSEMHEQMALGNERPMIPQQIDPPDQTKFRKILDPRFSRKRMQAVEPGVRADARALIHGFLDAGECEFTTQFAVPLPCNAFLHLMGLPSDDLGLFLRLKDSIIRPQAPNNDPEIATRIRADAGQEMYAYFRDLIAKRRKDPVDDLMTYFITAEVDGARLSDEDILDICFLFLIAGLDTVTATLGCNMAYLAENPAHREQLVADPARIPAAVEELLRWETPVTAVPRIAKKDLVLGDIEVKKGEMITVLIGAANVDGERFPDPAVVDFDRESNKHLAFGGGAHRCLGSHLARMELRVAMEEWHQAIPSYRVKPGVQPTYSPGIREVQNLQLVWPAD